MARKMKATRELKGRARLRSEIVEMGQGLNRLGMMSDGELEQMTLLMLGRDALPKVAKLSPVAAAGRQGQGPRSAAEGQWWGQACKAANGSTVSTVTFVA